MLLTDKLQYKIAENNSINLTILKNFHSHCFKLHESTTGKYNKMKTYEYSVYEPLSVTQVRCDPVRPLTSRKSIKFSKRYPVAIHIKAYQRHSKAPRCRPSMQRDTWLIGGAKIGPQSTLCPQRAVVSHEEFIHHWFISHASQEISSRLLYSAKPYTNSV